MIRVTKAEEAEGSRSLEEKSWRSKKEKNSCSRRGGVGSIKGRGGVPVLVYEEAELGDTSGIGTSETALQCNFEAIPVQIDTQVSL